MYCHGSQGFHTEPRRHAKWQKAVEEKKRKTEKQKA